LDEWGDGVGLGGSGAGSPRCGDPLASWACFCGGVTDSMGRSISVLFLFDRGVWDLSLLYAFGLAVWRLRGHVAACRPMVLSVDDLSFWWGIVR
jgi:hypothetical protein